LGVNTSIYTVWGTIILLIAYNALEFWVHGPFGDSRTDERHVWTMHPWKGPRANADDLFVHATSVAGESAFDDGIHSHSDLERWFATAYHGSGRWTDPGNRPSAYRRLWVTLPRRTRIRLSLRAPFTTPRTRRLLLEDFLDIWLTVMSAAVGGILGSFSMLNLAAQHWCNP
jgi:hypothetical protein